MRLCVCCGGRAAFSASSFAALSVPASLLPFSALGFFYDFSVVVCDSLNRERSICFPKSCRFLPFGLLFSIKEVFQPHLPIRLPCYDLALVTCFTLNGSLRLPSSGPPDFHGLTGGVYKARERIHRAMADARLLANPASRSRVADFDPN